MSQLCNSYLVQFVFRESKIKAMQKDEVYAFLIDALKAGIPIEDLREELEAAYRHVEGMKQRPIFSGIYPQE